MNQDFWAMGGYARYVWPCIGLGLAVLYWNLWSARRFYAAALRRAERKLAMAASERS
jgi:heme exporter protein CcmD